jgi:hypothetical protein
MKRQRAAWQMQAAMAQMSKAAEPLLDTVRESLGGKKEDEDADTSGDEPQDGLGAEEEGPEVGGVDG